MELSKETLDIICQALSERSRATSEVESTGITQGIRNAAHEDFKKTHKAWEEVEKLIQTKTKK